MREPGSRTIAEDVTSATFEKALRGLERYRWREPGIGPWLFRIASNELVDVYLEQYANPYIAAERGYVDEVIDPADTRAKIVAGLEMLVTKREEQPRRKHGIVPL